MRGLGVTAVQSGLWSLLGAAVPHRPRMISAGDRLAIKSAPIDCFLFPIGSVFVLARSDANDPQPLVSGMVGMEGMTGWSRFLGNAVWQHAVIAVVGGDAIEVRADDLLAAADADPDLRAIVLRYIHNYTLQQTQNTIANLGHSLERRLARWLTMVHDRSHGNDMRLTHETLAMILNVRRASITDALHILEGERLVRCTRGLVTVRDRAGLQAAAGYSYGYAEGDYNAAIGPFGKALAVQQPEHDPAG